MEIQINTRSVVTTRTASAEIDGARFEVSATLTDDKITAAKATIAEAEETTTSEGVPFTGWMICGYIIYENGSTRTERLSLAQATKYVPIFGEILEQMKGGVEV
jgi:hypothetical protein